MASFPILFTGDLDLPYRLHDSELVTSGNVYVMKGDEIDSGEILVEGEGTLHFQEGFKWVELEMKDLEQEGRFQVLLNDEVTLIENGVLRADWLSIDISIPHKLKERDNFHFRSF